jgi:hypothetical protein
MMDAGTPDQFRRVFPVEDNVEIHRSPAGFNEEIQGSIDVAFSETEVVEGEAVVETLRQLADFVERTIAIFEKRARRPSV